MNVHAQKRTPKAARTEAAIVAAALDLFAARGYAAVAVPEIAAAAGIAPGTIYRHFSSKLDLVNTVFAIEKTRLLACLLDEFRAESRSRERFAAIWRGLTRYATEAPSGFAFLELHHHGAYLSEENVVFEMQSLEMFARLLAEGSAAGEIKPIAPATLIVIVWATWVGLVKAANAGHLTLNETTLTDAERACWDAIAVHPSPA